MIKEKDKKRDVCPHCGAGLTYINYRGRIRTWACNSSRDSRWGPRSGWDKQSELCAALCKIKKLQDGIAESVEELRFYASIGKDTAATVNKLELLTRY